MTSYDEFMFEGKNTINSDPVLVAKVENNQKIVYKESLKKKLKTKNPIILVSILGKFQQGKSSTLKFLTRNRAHTVGTGTRSTTEGIYIDGPYKIDYLLEGFKLQKSVDLGSLAPDVFFLDIEGYDSDKTEELYQQLCVPFIGISSINMILMNVNEGRNSLRFAKDTLLLSQLSVDTKDSINNTKLMMIIRNITPQNIPNGTFDIIDRDNLNQTSLYLYNQMECSILKDSGIDFTISPLALFDIPERFEATFTYFAEDLIRNIESAAQSILIRDYQATMAHFDLITAELNNESFANLVSKSIEEQNQSTLNRFVTRSFNDSCTIMKKTVDDKLDEFRKKEKIPTDEFNNLLECAKGKAIDNFKGSLFIGLHTMDTSIQAMKQIELETNNYVNEMERKLFCEMSPSILYNATNNANTSCNCLINNEKNALVDINYFCQNNNKQKEIIQNIFTKIKDRFYKEVQNSLGKNISQIQNKLDQQLNTLQEIVTNDIENQYKLAYSHFCTVDRTFTETDDPKNNNFYLITECTTVRDPFGNIISSSSKEISRKIKPNNIIIHNIYDDSICSIA
ncbi:hypothetical protein TRFO_13493 [Tritrichomonas foetus]|uniref:Guanylate-binding protein N-terminal domain-containing protein n=1 Tax=Tritrichomonas foetus TaxID=1144522 RepID=A0A1J4L294_9EUKA|nr:hypothetical protein TRFO_13493 [Tritrichomonas foetus]|eukprot:OHT16013.1 hypothetical protein TRFO_13493 [Tritrichomonas foetus]